MNLPPRVWAIIIAIAILGSIWISSSHSRMSNHNFDYCDAIYTAGTPGFYDCMDH